MDQNDTNFCCITQEKGEIIYEPDATVRVDEFAFFVYWKSEGRVSCDFKGKKVVFLKSQIHSLFTLRKDRC